MWDEFNGRFIITILTGRRGADVTSSGWSKNKKKGCTYPFKMKIRPDNGHSINIPKNYFECLKRKLGHVYEPR